MKRIGYLYERIMTLENVAEAWRKYNANRPVHLRIEYCEARAQRILDAMRADFASVIGRPRLKTIYEGGKRRELQIPSFKSAIAQLAMWNVCGKYVERRVHAHSYSSRLGMGGHKAFRERSHFVQRHRRGRARYCLYFDVSKYYQHINHRILMDRLERIFKDRKVLDLFRIVIDSAYEGLPIGYPFSHALANLYLTPMYHLVMSDKRVSRGFVYMDNHLFFSRWKKALSDARLMAQRWLAGMGCTIKGDWQIFPTVRRAVKICGFCIRAGKTPRLYRRIWRNIMKNLDRLARDFALSDYLSLMSRKGWLMAIKKTYTPSIKLEGAYLW